MSYTKDYITKLKQQAKGKSLSVKNPKAVVKEEAQIQDIMVPSPENIEQTIDMVNLPRAGGPDLMITLGGINQDMKKVVLHNHISKLYKHVENLYQVVNGFDFDLVTNDKFELGYDMLIEAFEDYQNKLKAYLEGSFETDTYERALYTYLMLYQELILLVKLYNRAIKSK